MPVVISATVQGVLFSFIFDDQFGVANALLDKVGLGTQPFFADGQQALLLLVLAEPVGRDQLRRPSAPWCCLAALQDVPRELTEAASIDGARRWGVFRHVTLPALAPVLVVPAAVADGRRRSSCSTSSTARPPAAPASRPSSSSTTSTARSATSAYGTGAAASYVVAGGADGADRGGGRVGRRWRPRAGGSGSA